MHKSITTKDINKLRPAIKPFEIWDTEVTGLILRVEPTGLMTYYFQYRHPRNNKRKRLRLGNSSVMTPFQAKELVKSHLADIYQKLDPQEKKLKAQADNYLSFLEDTYKPWLESNLRTGRDTFANLLRCFPELHKLSLNEILPFEIEKWRQRRLKEGLKPSSLNRQIDDLKSMLNRAVEWKLIKENPLKGVKNYKVDKRGKIRYLTVEEESKLRKALDEREEKLKSERESANQWRAERGYDLLLDLGKLTFADPLKPAVLLSLNTGMRRGELFKLRWENVDFEQKHLTIIAETAKSGTTRHIPLNDEALHILKNLKKQQKITSIAGFVFSNNEGEPFHDLDTSWKAILKSEKVKIYNFRWHDLRHSFASKLVMAGVDLNTVRELLGHSDYKMTLRYAHLAPEHKAAAVAKLVTYQQQVV